MGKGFTLENVTFAYGQKGAVNNVSLQIPPGKLYGLVGPNGCGKSTLLDLLIANQEPQTGEVLYQGKALKRFSRRKLAREIALVPQDFGINFAFTVLEVVLMGRHPYIPRFQMPKKEDILIAREAMNEIGISNLQDRFVPELSGGEKQRVVIARSLAQKTSVLLLDEATSNLDIQHTLEIFRVSQRRVKEEGKTVIAVVHNLNLAAAYCDNLILMKNGSIHCAGPKEEVLTAENIRTVFGVKSRVQFDDFCEARQVSFKY